MASHFITSSIIDSELYWRMFRGRISCASSWKLMIIQRTNSLRILMRIKSISKESKTSLISPKDSKARITMRRMRRKRRKKILKILEEEKDNCVWISMLETSKSSLLSLYALDWSQNSLPCFSHKLKMLISSSRKIFQSKISISLIFASQTKYWNSISPKNPKQISTPASLPMYMRIKPDKSSV